MASNLEPVTLRTIADQLDLHPSTVSRVLSNPTVDAARWASKETVSRVRELAKELNYTPNPHAASLRKARSATLGVIVPRLQDYVLATVYEGIEEAAIENGYSTFVTNSLDNPDQQRAAAQMMLSRRVDGLIIGDAHVDCALLDELSEQGVPFVLTNRRSGDHLSVTCDNYLGGKLVGEHLLATGRRDPAILAGAAFASTAQDRVAGFVDAYAAAGITIPQDRIVFGRFDAEGGRSAANTVLASGSRPDAMFATNDFAAIGAMGVLRDHNISVPNDMAVVGYNDTPLSAEMSVPLTSVYAPMHAEGRLAFEAMLSLLRGEKPESISLEPRLEIRASSRRS